MTAIPSLVLLAAEAPDLTLLILLAIPLAMMLLMIGGLFVMFRSCYKIPPPDHALIRSGKDGLRATNGTGMWVIPIIHRMDLLSLAPVRIDLTGTKLDAEPAVSLQLPNLFQVEVINAHDAIVVAAQRLTSMSSDEVRLLAEDLVLGTLDRFLATPDDESSQDSPADRFVLQVEETLNSAGLRLAAARR